MKKPKYKTKDVFGILPEELHKAAVEYAKSMTGIGRPVREHVIYIETFRECFLIMRELKMVKKEYQ